MSENNIQQQINEINQKLDLVLNCALEQRKKSSELEDLLTDLSIVTKDAYNSAVVELDNRGIELNLDDLKMLLIKVIKNVNTFSEMIDTIESVNDFMKDFAPISKEIIVDFINKLYEFEKRGYFEYFNEFMNLLNKAHKYYSVEDFKRLSDNSDKIFAIINNLTQPQTLHNIQMLTAALSETSFEKNTNKSMYKLYKEINSKETKQSLSFLLSILKNFSNKQNNNNL